MQDLPFTIATSRRHGPTISFTSSLDCDAIVRTSTPYPTAHDLLTQTLQTLDSAEDNGQNIHLITSNKETPPLGLHATRALHNALQSSTSSTNAVDNFTNALEKVTSVARHSHLRDPVFSVRSAWAAEPGFSVIDNGDDNNNEHLLLFVRELSRLDDSALSNALPVAVDVLGAHRVHVVRLPASGKSKKNNYDNDRDIDADGDKDRTVSLSERSISAVVARLVSLARSIASERAHKASAAAFRARRATRTSFRSWLSSTSTTTPPLLLPDGIPTSSIPSSSSTSSSASTSTSISTSTSTATSASSSMPSLPSRSPSFSAALHAPQFDPASAEGLARRHADYAFVAGRFSEAADAYTQLSTDCRSLTGLAGVHEASAQEMTAISRAMVFAPPVAVIPSFERAIVSYARAARPELTVRACLRAAHFLTSYAKNNSQLQSISEITTNQQVLSLLLKARDAISISTTSISPTIATNMTTTAATGSAFIDAALAVLAAASSDVARLAGRRRRASLYAFVSMIRLSALGYDLLAGRVSDSVDEAALWRPDVLHHVKLVHAVAAAAEGKQKAALSLFASVLSGTSDTTDVELQGNTVRAFMKWVGVGEDEASEKGKVTWDSGASFPVVKCENGDRKGVGGEAVVETMDMVGGSKGRQKAWRTLEDDVLEDWEWVRKVRSSANDNDTIQEQQQKSNFRYEGEVKSNRNAKRASMSVPKRERRVENVVSELRRNDAIAKRDGGSSSIGGSVEMKLRRIREVARQRRGATRERSLLHRGAVTGEPITLRLTMYNPLQFPVFVDDLHAVISLDGKFHNKHDMNDDVVEFKGLDGVGLKPCERQEICVSVVLKQSGFLKFVGLTWRFTIGMGSAFPKASSDVKGFCVLNKQGKRLNSTRKQRASALPMYEEDQSLCARVVDAAPRLQAKIIMNDGVKQIGNGDIKEHDKERVNAGIMKKSNLGKSKEEEEVEEKPIVMRLGELRRATLVVDNVGELPMNDVIVIRSGMPNSIFIDVRPIHSCSGTSTTTCAIGANDETIDPSDAFVAAATQVNIAPNSSAYFPVWLRASVPASSLSSSSSTSSKKKKGSKSSRGKLPETNDEYAICHSKIIIAYGIQNARLCRAATSVCVRRSVMAFPRFMHETTACADNEKGVLLGVEVEHAGRSVEDNGRMQVSHIVLACKCKAGWKPDVLQDANVPVSDGSDSLMKEVAPSPTTLLINQTATVFVVVVRNEQHDKYENSNEWKCGSIELVPIEERKEELERERAERHFLLVGRHGWPAVAKDGDNEEWVFIAVRWRSVNGAQGDIHLPPLDPTRWMGKLNQNRRNSSTSTPATSPSVSLSNIPVSGIDESPHRKRQTEEPIKVTIEHPAEIEHNFYQDTQQQQQFMLPAVVDVMVRLKNVSRGLVDVMVSAPPVDGIADGDRGRMWAGDVAVSLRSVAPGAERCVRLAAVLVTPGRFNLGCIGIVVQKAGYRAARKGRFLHIEPSFIVVKDKIKANEIEKQNDVEIKDITIENGDEVKNKEGKEDGKDVVQVGIISSMSTTTSVDVDEAVVDGDGDHVVKQEKLEENTNEIDKVDSGVTEIKSEQVIQKKEMAKTKRRSRQEEKANAKETGNGELKSSKRRQRLPVTLAKDAAKKGVPSSDDVVWDDAETDEDDDEDDLR